MAVSASPALSLAHVKKSFGPTAAVADVSFEVQPGEMFGVIGPDGAGKTTTLRMICGLLKRDAGNIALFLDRKLAYDPKKNEFIGDEQANRLRSEALREPWRI